MPRVKEIEIVHSGAKFMTKEQVMGSKHTHFVSLDEHEKMYRSRETWKREYLKLKESLEDKQ